MMKSSLLLVLVLALVSVVNTTVARPLYNVRDAPSGWIATERAEPTRMVSISFYFQLRNAEALRKFALDISTPGHELYGESLTAEELAAWTDPDVVHSDAVVALLADVPDVRVVEHSAQRVSVIGTVAAIEKLLETELWSYVAAAADREHEIVRQLGRSALPDTFPAAAVAVTGLMEFPSRRSVSGDGLGAGRPYWMSPTSLNLHYNVPSGMSINPQSGLCIVELSSDNSFSYSDLESFEKGFGLPSYNVSHVVGPFNPNPADGESSLDVQCVASIAQGTTTWFMTVSNGFLDWATEYGQISGYVPQVVTISWGMNIVDHTSPNTEQYVQQTEAAFAKLVARRISIIVSSGDNGANGNNDLYCNTTSPLEPDYPSTSAYVTAVGATMIRGGKTGSFPSEPRCTTICWDGESGTAVGASQSDLSGITSGGGFSWLIQRPAYQNAAVSSYLSTAPLPPPSLFNSAGRGFPDVAIIGASYPTFVNGQWSGADGTSASAPVFASMVALINSQRLNAGKPTVGFLNPLLYGAAASAFAPIATGSDNKCTEAACCAYGYETESGSWSAVTGLGEPNFPALLKAALDASN